MTNLTTHIFTYRYNNDDIIYNYIVNHYDFNYFIADVVVIKNQ